MIDYRRIVNAGGGYFAELSDSRLCFVFGEFPDGTGDFRPTGKVYVFSHGPNPSRQRTQEDALADQAVAILGLAAPESLDGWEIISQEDNAK